MDQRPIIGIPTQTLQSLGGIPAEFPPSWVMSQRYITTLIGAGAIPWMIPLVASDEATTRGIYEALDGVFLPGGADIDPAGYGEERHAACDRSDPARDAMELVLARRAIEEGKPVLGVCRGLQLINLALGGTLYQDLAALREGSIKHDYFPFSGEFRRDHLAHPVRIAGGSRLAEIFGEGEVQVNSMHHQGIRDLAGALVATATAPDGLIEGAEMPGERFVVGVQWHPEVLTDSDARARRLFSEFIEASAEWARGAAVR